MSLSVYTLKDISASQEHLCHLLSKNYNSAYAICWENIILHSHPEIEISFKFIPKILMSKECIHFFGPLCIFKDDHHSFHASDFSIVASLATLFMQYFPEDGLAEKVHFPGHLQIPIWHLWFIHLNSCQDYVCMVRNSKPSAFERKHPRIHCSGTKGYAIAVWQEVVYRLDISRDTRVSIVATYFWDVRNYLTFPFRSVNFFEILLHFPRFLSRNQPVLFRAVSIT